VTLSLALLKFAALAALGGASVAIIRVLVRSGNAPGLQRVDRYIRRMDARLRRLFLPPHGRVILIVQVAGMVAIGAVALAAGEPAVLLLWPCIAWLPHLLLERRRRMKIEAKVGAFTEALANALRATPNIARALGTVCRTMPYPLDQELELTLRELRVGSTLDQALTDLSARVGSNSLDATISALLIGRRVGGNLPEILSETGASLREIHRMHAVLRGKTADGRVQSAVLAAFPLGVVLTFDRLSPGYFTPLTSTAIGSIIAVVAAVLWIAALVLSRRIMKVQL
jgi:tight adherence protein B